MYLNVKILKKYFNYRLATKKIRNCDSIPDLKENYDLKLEIQMLQGEHLDPQ